ncbi:GNAT superfamily N-acetyltransferase [Agrobacterium larrymoorei]|uniref:GNAT superfamily N-acetyltransferase n=1 Tax=Agrobacterium larrymoorei TaxID=160699 RepID=A0AAJ2B736_9HYPH|nr:GNAT family N-acetyltransferase [Agrobacterium larrymoorei]MDR6100576.1 GNAT superfamily N-acetyltransferase [Agrobacterium larrymoorei]
MTLELRITKLPNEPDDRHIAARDYCLKIIKDFYNIDHTPEWHADLDSLVTTSNTNWYSSLNKGAFWICQNERAEIIGSCGIYSMRWKPATLRRLSKYYSDGSGVCQLSRMYVREDLRGCGIGSSIEKEASLEAIQLQYNQIYLHADSRATDTLAYWTARKYLQIGRDEQLMIVDYNKKLHPY